MTFDEEKQLLLEFTKVLGYADAEIGGTTSQVSTDRNISVFLRNATGKCIQLRLHPWRPDYRHHWANSLEVDFTHGYPNNSMPHVQESRKLIEDGIAVGNLMKAIYQLRPIAEEETFDIPCRDRG